MTNGKGSRDSAIDAAKGILILLIVLGHNHVILRNVENLRPFLYNWHVYAFFLVAFILPVRRYDFPALVDRMVRYLVPFVAFLGLTTTLSWGMEGFADTGDRLVDFLKAVFIGSAYWT